LPPKLRVGVIHELPLPLILEFPLKQRQYLLLSRFEFLSHPQCRRTAD
jgi:hypothetical protein